VRVSTGKALGFQLKPRLRVIFYAEGLARGQVAELHFSEIEDIVFISFKQPKPFQVLLSFSWSMRARGLLVARLAKKF
jgi:hypothetical protein